ncbi:hypothetical protein DSO57_1017397 [Entomophthora muscae]|uniref:Uncharacterized protein n=1 Tax=Entomophthora muscae TaxID=34485 RepID=A0ACC2STH1_9FUNG|nr:hypothetical protein DSO57_1017397 [Entomophthora muscae]
MELTVTSITVLQRLINCFTGIKEDLAEIPAIQPFDWQKELWLSPGRAPVKQDMPAPKAAQRSSLFRKKTSSVEVYARVQLPCRAPPSDPEDCLRHGWTRQ